jgi:hypothetical protein
LEPVALVSIVIALDVELSVRAALASITERRVATEEDEWLRRSPLGAIHTSVIRERI